MKIIKLTLILCFALTALYAQDNNDGSKKSNKTVSTDKSSIKKSTVDLTKYYISIDGVNTAGPFDLEALKKKAKEGTLTNSTWVVKIGDKEWQSASAYPDLKSAIEAETPRLQQEVYVPPPLPIDKKLSDTTKFSDGVQANKETKKRSFEPYAPVLPQDVLYSKRLWRNVDFREKLNQSFIAKESNIISIVNKLLKNGDIVAFQDEKFTTRYSVADAMARYKEDKEAAPEDTMKVKQVDGSAKEDNTTQANIDYTAVVGGIRIKEDWIFDKIRQELEPRIVGMAFYKKSKAEVEQNKQRLMQSKVGGTTNNPKAKVDSVATNEKIVFWVNFDQIRPYLHKEIVINNYNDAAPLSFDDLLVKRIFASYIVQESNINGTDIKKSLPNSTPQDRLRESERIKKALMDWEHDLWSY